MTRTARSSELRAVADCTGELISAREQVQNLDELFGAGRAGVLTDDITNLTGLAPRTFHQWAEHHAGAFK